MNSATAVRTAELSCYTANLVAYLDGDALTALAHAVRLEVRTDLPDVLAFSHHERVDGGQLAYRGAVSWAETRAGLLAELERHGSVLAVGNTRCLPWSPQFRRSSVPHWILLEGHEGTLWRVADHFAALLPAGEQQPHAGLLHEADLRRAMTPFGPLPREVEERDRHALGTEVAVPAAQRHRWLIRRGTVSTVPADEPVWLSGTPAVLTYLGQRLAEDGDLLARHTDDLWAAARHHRLRLAVLTDAGQIAPDHAERAARGWAELPRALRFAAESALRGRPRPSVVTRAFEALIEETGS